MKKLTYLHLFSIHIFNLIRSGGICIGLAFILIFISVKTLACPLELPVATISIKGYMLIVELATTPTARGCGLSNRVKLPQNKGMLFIYPNLGPRTFWMSEVLPYLLGATSKLCLHSWILARRCLRSFSLLQKAPPLATPSGN